MDFPRNFFPTSRSPFRSNRRKREKEKETRNESTHAPPQKKKKTPIEKKGYRFPQKFSIVVNHLARTRLKRKKNGSTGFHRNKLLFRKQTSAETGFFWSVVMCNTIVLAAVVEDRNRRGGAINQPGR